MIDLLYKGGIMSDHKRHLNPLLLLIAVLLCLSASFLFQRTSFDPDYKITAIWSYETKKSAPAPEASVTKAPQKADHISATPTAVPSVTPSEPPVKKEASPEAANGTWTSSGSHWMFLVNGTPYTGWLIDTDGKHYYFDKDGIMQTGWINDNGKRYYLDLDGIMQTGTVSIDGKDYELQTDGSLKK